MAPAAATDTRPPRLNEPAKELRFSVELARISTLLFELTTAPVPIYASVSLTITV